MTASPTPPGSRGPEGARDCGVQGGARVLPAPRRGLPAGELWSSLEWSGFLNPSFIECLLCARLCLETGLLTTQTPSTFLELTL